MFVIIYKALTKNCFSFFLIFFYSSLVLICLINKTKHALCEKLNINLVKGGNENAVYLNAKEEIEIQIKQNERKLENQNEGDAQGTCFIDFLTEELFNHNDDLCSYQTNKSKEETNQKSQGLFSSTNHIDGDKKRTPNCYPASESETQNHKPKNKFSDIRAHFDFNTRRIAIRRYVMSKSLFKFEDSPAVKKSWFNINQNKCSSYNLSQNSTHSSNLDFFRNLIYYLLMKSLLTVIDEPLENYLKGKSTLIETIIKSLLPFYVFFALSIIILFFLFLSCCSFSKFHRKSIHALTGYLFFRDRPRVELEEISKKKKNLYILFYSFFLCFLFFFIFGLICATQLNHYFNNFLCAISTSSYKMIFGNDAFLSSVNENEKSSRWKGLKHYYDFYSSKQMSKTIMIRNEIEVENKVCRVTKIFETHLLKELYSLLEGKNTNISFLSLIKTLENARNVFETLNVNHNCYIWDYLINTSGTTKQDMLKKFDYKFELLKQLVQSSFQILAPSHSARLASNVELDIEEINKSVFDIYEFFNKSNFFQTTSYNFYIFLVFLLIIALPAFCLSGWIVLYIRCIYINRREVPIYIKNLAAINSVCFGLYAALCFFIGGLIISLSGFFVGTCNFADTKLFDQNLYLEYPRLFSLLPTNKKIIDHCLTKKGDGSLWQALKANATAFTSSLAYEKLSQAVENAVSIVDVFFFENLYKQSKAGAHIYMLDPQSVIKQNKSELLVTYNEVLNSGVQWEDVIIERVIKRNSFQVSKKEMKEEMFKDKSTSQSRISHTFNVSFDRKPEHASLLDKSDFVKENRFIYGLNTIEKKINEIVIKYAHNFRQTSWCFHANPKGCPSSENIVVIDADTNVFTDPLIQEASAEITTFSNPLVSMKWKNALHWVVEKHKILRSQGYTCYSEIHNMRSCSFLEFSGVSSFGKTDEAVFVKQAKALYERSKETEDYFKDVSTRWKKKILSIFSENLTGLNDLEEADCVEEILKPVQTAIYTLCYNANPNLGVLGVFFCCLAVIAIFAWVANYKIWHFLYDHNRLFRQLHKLRSLKEKVKNRKKVQMEVAVYNNDDVQFMMKGITQDF